MTVDARVSARRPLHFAVGGALVVATAFIPGAESMAADQNSEVALAYECEFPSGAAEVGVTVSASLPASVGTGEAVRPDHVSVVVKLPQAALEQFTGQEATSLSADAQLTVRHRSGDRSADAAWANLDAPPVPIPAEGGLELTATGDVPTATFGSPGKATLAPAGLALALTPRKADNSPTTPPSLQVVCEPAPDQDTTLATVLVEGSRSGSTPEPEVSTPKPDTTDTRPGAGFSSDTRKKIKALTDRTLDGEDDPGGSCPIVIPPEWVMTTADTYVAGYANAAKMDGAVALGPAHMKVTLNKVYINDSCASTVDVTSEAEFEYQGRRQLPPAKSTFLTYGFMPTTAVVELEQVGPPAVVQTHTVTNTPEYPESTTVTTQLSMRIHDVKVNGVPLDVGDNCRTAEPFEQVLKAWGQSYPRSGYLVAYGGTLSGYAHIPPFKGCGVDENLDAVFTSAISSAGKAADNYTKMTQAALCVATNPDGPDCPPKIPTPER
ncbi:MULTISPECIES: DUF6801 domain-containing protein [unclassified Streptomyces]|uniref:DUF6801 domain-containing protein n=1 Tax=unclassified Streptomyces TaxID=2593676 RepID=UPI0035DF6ADC